jgi:effector-binding domain-containing protein
MPVGSIWDGRLWRGRRPDAQSDVSTKASVEQLPSQERPAMTYDIETRELPGQTAISIREQIRPADLPAFIGRSFADLIGHARLLAIPVAGEPFAIYHSFGADAIDVEIGLPIHGPVEATGRISTREMPPVTVAETVHAGPYEGLADAYAALAQWIEANGFEVVGPIRELYLDGPGSDVPPSAYRTIIAMPILRIPVLTH